MALLVSFCPGPDMFTSPALSPPAMVGIELRSKKVSEIVKTSKRLGLACMWWRLLHCAWACTGLTKMNILWSESLPAKESLAVTSEGPAKAIMKTARDYMQKNHWSLGVFGSDMDWRSCKGNRENCKRLCKKSLVLWESLRRWHLVLQRQWKHLKVLQMQSWKLQETIQNHWSLGSLGSDMDWRSCK